MCCWNHFLLDICAQQNFKRIFLCVCVCVLSIYLHANISMVFFVTEIEGELNNEKSFKCINTTCFSTGNIIDLIDSSILNIKKRNLIMNYETLRTLGSKKFEGLFLGPCHRLQEIPRAFPWALPS